MSVDRFGPRPGQCWSGSDAGRWESAHRPGDDGTCNHWDSTAGAYCLAVEDLHLFAQGVRCPLHTPRAMRLAAAARLADITPDHNDHDLEEAA